MDENLLRILDSEEDQRISLIREILDRNVGLIRCIAFGLLKRRTSACEKEDAQSIVRMCAIRILQDDSKVRSCIGKNYSYFWSMVANESKSEYVKEYITSVVSYSTHMREINAGETKALNNLIDCVYFGDGVLGESDKNSIFRSPETSVDELLVKGDAKQALAKAIQDLSPEIRDALILPYKQYPYDKSISAYNWRRKKAKTFVAKALIRQGYDVFDFT